MVFGKLVNVPKANQNAIIMDGDDGRTCIQNSATKAIVMVQCKTNHVSVADKSGNIIETRKLESVEDAQSTVNSLIVKYSWLC